MVETTWSSTRERIVRELRSTEKPALSAAKLAEELEVSVRTINNHVDELVENDRVQSMRIGNASAYYIPDRDRPAHQKPDFNCKRCGRSIQDYHDHAKIEYNTYFEQGNLESSVADFYIFCRFCYSDFVSWVRDPGTMGEYPFVDEWDISDRQLEEVKSDPEIVTEYDPDS